MPGTPATSPRLAIPRFANSDAADFSSDVNSVVDQIDDVAARISSGTFAARPAAGIADQLYFATDRGVLYRDSGSAWSQVDPADLAITTAKLADDAVATAKLADDAVTGDKYVIQTSEATSTYTNTSTGYAKASGGTPDLSITPPAGTWRVQLQLQIVPQTSTPQTVTIELHKNGVAVWSIPFNLTSAARQWVNRALTMTLGGTDVLKVNQTRSNAADISDVQLYAERLT